MRFIFEALDKAKEKIQKAFNAIKKRFQSNILYIFVKIVILKFKQKINQK